MASEKPSGQMGGSFAYARRKRIAHRARGLLGSEYGPWDVSTDESEAAAWLS